MKGKLNNTYRTILTTFSKCVICGNQYKTKKSHLQRRKTCSKACFKEHLSGITGSSAPAWKGGIHQTTQGYLVQLVSKSKGQGHHVLQHRLVMERHLRRKLKGNEQIHHIDGNRQNNDISNLKLVDRLEHLRFHLNQAREKLRNNV